jgi:hypothetical protein
MVDLSEGSKSRKKGRPSAKPKTLRLPYGRQNYLLLLLGLLAVVLGFIFLLRGDTVVSPVLFVLGWTVLIPVGLFHLPRRRNRAA